MKTPVQKGKIDPNPKTMKTTTIPEKQREANEMNRERMKGQQCSLQIPKH